MSVLLIEDDLSLAESLARALQKGGFRVETAGNVQDACQRINAQVFGVIVLDLGLPDGDGGEVIKYLKARQIDTPVLVYSARATLQERIRLLDAGADDYLVKPAAIDEFLARVRALLRRRRGGVEARMTVGRLALDMDGKRAYLDDQPLDLNSREWTLLALFASAPNRVVAKNVVAEALYRSDESISANAVDQIMSRFRRRVADSGLNLRTVRGLGYYLETGNGGINS
jgi:two-component system OmpR family response regulator